MTLNILYVNSNITTAGRSIVIAALQCCQILNVVFMGSIFLLEGVKLFFWEKKRMLYYFTTGSKMPLYL